MQRRLQNELVRENLNFFKAVVLAPDHNIRQLVEVVKRLDLENRELRERVVVLGEPIEKASFWRKRQCWRIDKPMKTACVDKPTTSKWLREQLDATKRRDVLMLLMTRRCCWRC